MRLTQTVQEVTNEDPYAMSVDSLLETQVSGCELRLKPVVGDAVQKGNFLDYLVNGSFYCRMTGGCFGLLKVE